MSKLNRITDLEKKYVMEVLDHQFRNSLSGQLNRRLEERFAAEFGVKFAMAQVNGTTTLHTALVAVGVQPGDEVIVPPLTMMSTTFGVLHAGAVPVYADVDPATFNIDPKSIERAITPKTRAIITVALFGLSPDMDAIMAIAKKHNIFVIEDNAQCFRGFYKGRIVGSIGHMASYSFQGSKHLTSGEGGMLITNDEKFAEKMRRFGTLGYASVGAAPSKAKITRDTIQDPQYERHNMVGWNYRMPEPCAAIALAQTERMKELVDQRAASVAFFQEAVKGCDWLTPQAIPEGYIHAWWTFVLKLNPGRGISWYEFRQRHREMGGDGVYAAWKINYLEPVLRGQKIRNQEFKAGLCPVAESLQPQLIQFKTNYWDLDVARQKADALRRTIESFSVVAK